MNMKKKILSLSLASTLLLGTVACAATDKVVISETPEKEVTNVVNDLEKDPNYINHKGKITEVNNENGVVSIVVDQKEVLKDSDKAPAMEIIKFNLRKDTVVLNAETQEFMKADGLELGMVVEVAYAKDSPVTKSLPPMTNADVVVVRPVVSEDIIELGVKVDRFDKEHISEDNMLRYNLTDDTVIVDVNGKDISDKELVNRDLVVFYGPAVTMSIPAQGNAVKIIVLNTKSKPETPEANTEVKVLDRVNYNGKEIKLKNKMYKSGDTLMIPIRDVGEALGYKVSWQSVAKQVELTKGTHYLTATANQDMYSFSKMIVKLGKASIAEKGVTYVPVKFIEEVMQLEMNVNKDGFINIK